MMEYITKPDYDIIYLDDITLFATSAEPENNKTPSRPITPIG